MGGLTFGKEHFPVSYFYANFARINLKQDKSWQR